MEFICDTEIPVPSFNVLQIERTITFIYDDLVGVQMGGAGSMLVGQCNVACVK